MAVKLMPVAPVGPGQPAAPAEPEKVEEQPKQPRKRRRAAVYDADGNEVLITLKCLKCNRMHPLSNFGLRKMADGAIRNQPWCRECRGASSPKKKKGEAAAEVQQGEVLVASDAPAQPQPPAAEAQPAPQLPPATPAGPMQVVPLTAEQVLRALAPQLLAQVQQQQAAAQQQPVQPQPAEPAVEPELDDDGEPEPQ